MLSNAKATITCNNNKSFLKIMQKNMKRQNVANNLML